jgi:hypothetical protein
VADDWEVIYKATADFADLTRKAREASATLKELQAAAKAESDAEIKGATEAAAAHDRDTKAIEKQTAAMAAALATAKEYNRQVNQGGRSTPDQHVSDLAREAQQQQLLNVKRQRGFSSPQQDFAYRQQEVTQRKLANVANWEGYQSKDQYLNSMQREAQQFGVLNAAWARRAQLVRENTDALARHQSTQAGRPNTTPGQAPATTSAASPIEDARNTLKQLTDQISRARTDSTAQDSSSVTSQLAAVQGAIRKIQADTKGLDLQPKGLSDLKQAFADAQAAAGRAFPDIEAKSKSAADGIAGKWQQTRGAFRDVFTDVRVSAETAASDVEGSFSKAAAGIKGSFSGLGGGSGGGIASAFGDLAGTVGSMAQNIPGMVGLITAAILALIQLLPALAAGLGAVGSAAAVLPDFLGAAGGAFATFQSAISPVIDALGKYMALLNAQEAIQAHTIATVMQQEQAYHSLADAQFSLTQAVVQGNNQQLTSAHSLADAQFSLKEAYFQAGITQIQSSMQVASAMHGLQDAQFAVTQAQYALNIAWQQARFQLQQLELQVGAASLNLRGAQLNLMQAQQNYATVMASSTSTALDRAQAAYQIQVAEQSLKQVTLQNTQNETQLANVRKYGMQQVFGVTQAQHSLADAQFAQVQAQKQLVVTEKEAANAQIESAHAIMDAIFGVQQARFQESQGAVQSAHQISDAQFSVHQGQLQLKEDAQAGGAAASSAYEALQVALSQLSPAAKQAVKDLEPIFVWWNNNTKAQQAFFGVFDKSLERLGSHDVGLIKPLNDMLDAIAKALGGVAGKFVDWLASMANSPLWKLLTRTSVSIITDLGDGALYFAKGLAELAKIAAPLATWMAAGIERLGKQFLTWATTEAKPGSMLHLLLREAVPALQALGQLLKSIVIFFGILAGGTPTYNKQGALTGVIPSDSQNSAFKTFLTLLGSLSNTVLPNLALLLNKLASPQLANSLITLLGALSTLLLQVVSSPGFLTGFTAFVGAFSTLVSLFGDLVSYTPLGSLIGVLAGAFVALSVLKFTGILALLTNLAKIKDWIGGIRSASGVFGKLSAMFGGSGGGLNASAQTAADTLAGGGAKAGESLVASAGEAADILAAGGAKAGAAERAGGAAGGAETAAGGAGGAAAGAVESGGIGSMIGGALRGLPAAILTLSIPIEAVALIFHRSFGTEIAYMAGQFKSLFVTPVTRFFGYVLPKYLSDQDFRKYWSNANAWWMQYVQNPVTNFFSTLLPNWLGGAGQGWKGLWDNAQNLWVNDIWHPLDNFFNNTVPGWFDDITRLWDSLWSGGWSTFQKKILDPMENWFTSSLPRTIEGAFKTSLNFVITNALDKVIGWINDATKLVGIPAIPKIPTLGTGGRMGLAGGGPRQDNRLARLSDGEFVVNAEATRRHLPLIEAINAQGMASGGGVGGFFSGLWSNITHGAGDLWGAVSSLFGGAGSDLAKLKNLVLRDGAVPVVNSMWSHLVNPLLGAAGITSQSETRVIPHLVGFLASKLHTGLDSALATIPGGTAGLKAMPGKGGVSGNVASYTADIAAVLKQLGEPASDLGAVEHRMTQESGGNPTIVNRWDSNWLAGHPSVGLMQVIQGTFDAYAGPYRNTGPFEYGVSVNPMANIFAGLNYAKHAYSEPLIDVMLQPGGYHDGGRVHNRTHHSKHRPRHHHKITFPGTPGPLGIMPPVMQPFGGPPDLYDFLPLGPDLPFFAGGGFAGLPPLFLGAPRAGAMLAGGSAADRVLSAAGASGRGRSGFSVGEINIHNPLPERAGDSLTRSVMKMQFLAGRDAI